MMLPYVKAINYALRHWDGLTRFREYGRYLIDNNHTEQVIYSVLEVSFLSALDI